jgi:hypothetical protein
MFIGGVENMIRYLAVVALAVVLVFAALLGFGLIHMPGDAVPAKSLATVPGPAAPTPRAEPSASPVATPASGASPAAIVSGDQSAGEGSFQSDSAASPSPSAQ